MGAWERFWKWHYDAIRDPTPIIGFSYYDDGVGNKDCKFFIGKSKFWYKEQIDFEKESNKDLLDYKKRKLLKNE